MIGGSGTVLTSIGGLAASHTADTVAGDVAGAVTEVVSATGATEAGWGPAGWGPGVQLLVPVREGVVHRGSV